LLAEIILDYGFPTADEMQAQAVECFSEAVSVFPDKYPHLTLDRNFLESNRADMVTLLGKTMSTHRGVLRDKIRELVSKELDDVVEHQPPTVYTSNATGEVRSFKDEKKTIIQKYISDLFRGYRYLDAPRKLSGRNASNALNSPVLRNAIICLYNNSIFQKALRASPSFNVVMNGPIRPLDPDYWMHWSDGCPPLLVTFVGTLLCACYGEWDTGKFVKTKLTDIHGRNMYLDVRERIMCDWGDQKYQDAIRARFREWVRQSDMVLA
jgi:hypothetical protein